MHAPPDRTVGGDGEKPPSTAASVGSNSSTDGRLIKEVDRASRRRPHDAVLGEGGYNSPVAAKRNKLVLSELQRKAPSQVSAMKKTEVDNCVKLMREVFKKGPILKDLGGIDGVIEELTRKVLVPFHHPKMQLRSGATPITGILLTGPPGCGKTTLARALANETRVPLFEISAPQLMETSNYGIPDENARAQILTKLTKNVSVDGGGFDVGKIASSTPGFVGADLEALVDEAANLAIVRVLDKRKIDNAGEDYWKQPSSDEEVENVVITMPNFEVAAKKVQPSLKREGFCDIPNVMWADVGGLDSLKQEFELYIIRRIRFPQDYADFGVDQQTSFLLYGPPGCGKTLIVKAVAAEAGANFIHIKGPELLNKYYGESELAVRTLFSRARICTPCILFFDEVDALTTTNSGTRGGCNYEGLLKQLLVELDGVEQRKGVYVIGATNGPEAIDRAMLRPARFGKPIYVPLPSPDERGMILRALARNKPIDADLDLMALGKHSSCNNLSGADLSNRNNLNCVFL